MENLEYVKKCLDKDLQNCYSVYHYKSFDIFKDILENGFQVTNIEFFNDPKDGLLPYDEIIDFGENNKKNKKVKKIIYHEIAYEKLFKTSKNVKKEVKNIIRNIFNYIDVNYDIYELNAETNEKSITNIEKIVNFDDANKKENAKEYNFFVDNELEETLRKEFKKDFEEKLEEELVKIKTLSKEISSMLLKEMTDKKLYIYEKCNYNLQFVIWA